MVDPNQPLGPLSEPEVHRADFEKFAWIKALIGPGNLITIILFASFLAKLVSCQTTQPLLCL